MRADQVQVMDVIDHVMVEVICRKGDMIHFHGADVRTGRRRELVRFKWENAEDRRRKPRPWEEIEEIRRLAAEGRRRKEQSALEV